MHKSLVALVGAAGIGFAALAAPAPANADCFGCAVGAGVLGGLFAGAVVGSAIANSPPPPPGYYPPPPLRARIIRRRLRARIIRRRPAPIRRPPLTPSWRPVAIGDTAGFGLKASAINGGPSRSVPDRAA